MIHTTPAGQWQIFCKPFINFAVAAFIFLSGYLTKTDNDNWLKFYTRRISRVLVPYIIWTVIYSIPDIQSAGLLTLAKNLLCANATTTLYYIFVYIQFVLLTPLLGKLAKSPYRHLGWLIAPLSVILFKYIPVFGGIEQGKHIQLFWNDACLGWFTFYYLGLILGNRIIDRKFNVRNLTVLYCASLLLQMAEGYLWYKTDPAGCGSQLKLSSILSSSIFILLMYSVLLNRNQQPKSRLLCMIGDYSFGIYLVHMLILKWLQTLDFYNIIPYPINSIAVLAISFIFCCTCSTVFGKKFGRWVGLV
jgi:surface polysaccharide O-acyltransferase-like enzyme